MKWSLMGGGHLREVVAVKDIEQRNSFLIRSIINYFVCLVTIVVTMFICFPIGL